MTVPVDTPVIARPLLLVVDDEPPVLKIVERLATRAGFEVVSCGSGAEAMRTLARRPADLALVDLRMPDVNGLELQRALSDASALTVVFLTGHADVQTSVAAMKAGAADFLTKPVEEDRLLAAVSRAVEQSVAAQEADRERIAFLARLARLTPRERQVGALVIQGLLNKQIAGELGTAEKTVKVHRARVMEKMRAGSVAELVRLADAVRVVVAKA